MSASASASPLPPPPGSLILVTGANGFLATHVVADLLASGYSVRGTLRPSSLANESKTAHLRALADKYPELTLELVPAELDDVEALTAAAAGTAAVMHTASPYVLDVNDPVEELLRPAVMGTYNTLAAAAASPSVARVVLTSSMAAVTDSPDNGHVYTETDWNVKSTVARNPYYASKALAEKEAWKFVGSPIPLPDLPTDGLIETPPPPAAVNFDLVVINPFVIVGPEPSPAVNTSNGILRDIMDGKYPATMDLNWCFVHVHDVAHAHTLALTNPAAQGRYLTAHDAISMADTVALLKTKYPDHPLPKRDLSCKIGTGLTKMASYFQPKAVGSYLRTNLSKVCHLDNTKVRELGLEFTPVNETIVSAVEDLRTNAKLKVECMLAPDELSARVELRAAADAARGARRSEAAGRVLSFLNRLERASEDQAANPSWSGWAPAISHPVLRPLFLDSHRNIPDEAIVAALASTADRGIQKDVARAGYVVPAEQDSTVRLHAVAIDCVASVIRRALGVATKDDDRERTLLRARRMARAVIAEWESRLPGVFVSFHASLASMELAARLAARPLSAAALRAVILIPELRALALIARNPLHALSRATGVPVEVFATRVFLFLLPDYEVPDAILPPWYKPRHIEIAISALGTRIADE
ncbi:NAD-dependent epimerase/dehydratase [Thecamonas trahens ATCC 50062]|uniref:NAD-dependent epimerase/dehydratase n=1 Tax=Thecamonas trahens ATCC 50062 TaxID=461836 RepID=A0A0L0D440_THETB|nr:NAD-dependent epimerase/dehydratase [Thecamonas trahens ATCC 50062]KNC47117.1 NAD-dependent epimerase/dehydratase [Thecamonas trahens ATCC 50062]|eukprot:XP_013759893.1 NAD-dependent epimerase/dehydratase [Thecamonas trahens ATCC 50062]